MCRLLGMAGAVGLSEARKPLLREFFELSVRHPDGWGLAFYEGSKPTVIKRPGTARTSKLLPSVIEEHKSELIMAHIRDGTKGGRTMENTHPFQYGRWTFGHNGTIDMEGQLLGMIDEELRANIKGGTDSEILFHWLLHQIKEEGDIVTGIETAIAKVLELKGRRTSALNFTLCDGESFYALNLPFKRFDYYTLAWKRLPNEEGVLVSSVPIGNAEGWTDLQKGELLVVGPGLKLERRIIG